MDRFEFFSKLPRREPGSATFTSAYLSGVSIKATDLACEIGADAGTTAVWIARSRGCAVVAVDSDPRALPRVVQHAEEGGSSGLVLPICADYRNLPFADQSFQIVIAESAAMGLGLGQALTLWRRLISPKGHLAIAHPGVVNKSAPPEVRGPLERRLSEPLGTVADYQATIRATGYELVHQCTLPNEIWDVHYNNCVRHVWALIKDGVVREDDPVLESILEEARWFRQIGRGRVYLLAMVLRRIR